MGQVIPESGRQEGSAAREILVSYRKPVVFHTALTDREA